MKKYFTLGVFSLLFITITHAQVGVPGNKPNKNAVLDLNNTDGTNIKGLLLPKVALTSTTSASPMTAHVAGMKVYNTATASTGLTAVSPGIYTSDGTRWIRSGSTGDEWSITGNAGTNPTTDFLGTTDAKDFVIKTNNTEQMRVASSGQILIGTSTVPTGGTNAKVIVDNGTKGGAIQLRDGTQADGAVLMSDANGVAKWFRAGNIESGTGIYYVTWRQDFPMGQEKGESLGTDRQIILSEPGSYLVSLRWWGETDDLNYQRLAMAEIGLRKNNTVEVDMVQQYATKITNTDGRICFTTNLIAKDCLAGDILDITVKPIIGGTWQIGTVNTTTTNWMPSIMVVKL